MDRSVTVLNTADAVAAWGRSRVRTELRRGRWTTPVRGVVVTHNGPLNRDERLAVALAASAPGSALAGPSALEVDGLEGFTVDVPHVVRPEGARRPSLLDVVTHVSTMLDERDIHPRRLPRRTRPGRSVIDAASWAPTARRARALVLATAQQGLVRPRDVREALTRRGTCRHRAIVVQSVLDAAGGKQSLPERDFDDIWRSGGLPPPARQAPVRRSDGRFYLDVEWSRYRVACEIHGIPHMAVERWDDDQARANEIVLGGRRLLVFSSFAIRHHPWRVGAQLARLLVSGGWTPPSGTPAAAWTGDETSGPDVGPERIILRPPGAA